MGIGTSARVFRGTEEQCLVIKQNRPPLCPLYLAQWYHHVKPGVKLGINKFRWSQHISVARRFFLRDRLLAEGFIPFLRQFEGIHAEIVTVDASRLLELSESIPFQRPSRPLNPKPITQIEIRTQRKPWNGL